MSIFSEAVNHWINTSQAVIPAKAGIQYHPLIHIKNIRINELDPGLRRVSEIMIFHRLSGRVVTGHVYALFKASHPGIALC